MLYILLFMWAKVGVCLSDLTIKSVNYRLLPTTSLYRNRAVFCAPRDNNNEYGFDYESWRCR